MGCLWAPRPFEPDGFCGRKATLNHAYSNGHSLSLICQPTSEDMKLYVTIKITVLWEGEIIHFLTSVPGLKNGTFDNSALSAEETPFLRPRNSHPGNRQADRQTEADIRHEVTDLFPALEEVEADSQTVKGHVTFAVAVHRLAPNSNMATLWLHSDFVSMETLNEKIRADAFFSIVHVFVCGM